MTRQEIAAPTQVSVTQEQLELVKKTVASGATDAELKLYLYDCQRQGVHPLDRLLHFTKRGGKYTPVTSIDLMRIRAAETGEYAGSDDAEFGYAEKGDGVDYASVTVWRLTQGQRYAYTSTARWAEYYPGDAAGAMWRKMPHTMLAKCAEALALRKGFPRQLAGLYAKEELDQADRSVAQQTTPTVALEAGAAVNAETGEELPAPPPGYHYVDGYRFNNGWHEFQLLNYDAKGGAIKLSTKKAIGFLAEQAQAERIPVKVTTAPKKGNPPGEAYLDSITKAPVLPKSLKPFTKPPAEPTPTECPVCGLAWAECSCDKNVDSDIPF